MKSEPGNSVELRNNDIFTYLCNSIDYQLLLNMLYILIRCDQDSFR